METTQFLAALGVVAFLSSVPLARADATLDKIKSRGTVVVGVVLSGPPFGYVDPKTQQQLGLNVDLAADIAKRLGVKLETVAVTPATRVQFLQQGKVDIAIPNMQLNPERAELMGYVPTPYGDAGGGLITLKSNKVTRWEDVKGKTICLSQGSNYAKPLAELYGADVKGLPSQPDSLLALKGGNCFGSVHDSAPLHLLVSDNPEWKDFELPLANDLIPLPSVIWVRKGETDLINVLDGFVQDWYRSGWLFEVTRKNRIPITPLLEEWQAKYPVAQK
ncbi:MAG: transporter substrate-binding domain-containing protein [Candidatus Accumulibacter sp.]|nr:transporter substrate-binding domain-containing protein [Accumulibacter sp.]